MSCCLQFYFQSFDAKYLIGSILLAGFVSVWCLLEEIQPNPDTKRKVTTILTVTDSLGYFFNYCDCNLRSQASVATIGQLVMIMTMMIILMMMMMTIIINVDDNDDDDDDDDND